MSRVTDILNRPKRKQTVQYEKTSRPVFVEIEVAQELKEYCVANGVTMKDMAGALIQDFLDEEYNKSVRS